jgi:hypothetical protein
VVFIASHFILSLLIIAVNMCKERDILLAKSVAKFMRDIDCFGIPVFFVADFRFTEKKGL